MKYTDPHKPLTKAQLDAIKPGDTITILIRGKKVITTIDGDGTQRLPCHPFIEELMRGKWTDLAMRVGEGKLAVKFARKLYQMVGYSVCGYGDVFSGNGLYPYDEIINPLWTD